MSNIKLPIKVFLCHTSADKPQVRKLYSYLKRRGVQPWLDIEDLLPGQDWQIEIPKVIASSDAIIICLSENSVDKEGFVQKEIKFALDKALEMPDGYIFLIPARLNKCDVPFRLNKYQWVDLFEEGGNSRLLNSLKLRASQLARKNIELPNVKGAILKSKNEAVKGKPNKTTTKSRIDPGDVGVGGDVANSVIVVGNGNVINFDTQSTSDTSSKKIPQNATIKSLEKKPELRSQNISRVRFLDALDSARFSSKLIYQESRLFSGVYVKVQFFFALICGDSIVVTENQLFDSLGFLESFYEFYISSKKVAPTKNLPIKVALREGNDVFQTVAKHFENKDFELTLWEELNRDVERRKIWASHIRNRQKPIGKFVVNAKEKNLVERLWTILEYFSPEHCVHAEKTDEFLKRVKLVLDQDDLRLDALVTGIYKEGVEERRYLDTWDEVRAAKELRDALKVIQEKVGNIDTRSKVRKQLEGFENTELRQGVIELTDGLYNQSLGVATKAKLVQNSTFPPQRRNNYVAAGYALSTFINDKSNPSGDFVDSEIFSFDYFDNLQRLDDPKRKDELFLILETAQKSAPWEKIIEIQEKESWKISLLNFNNTLAKLQLTVRKNKPGSSLPSMERIKLIKELDDLREKLKGDWKHHIENIGDSFSNDCWSITPKEMILRHPNVGHGIRIPYSYLQPKIDREYIDGFKTWRNNSSFKGILDGSIDSPA